jgi:TIR domain
MAGKIFISYRRDDSAAMAGRLHDRLAETFGQANLFIDVDNMPAGADFVKYLNKQVGSCDIFLCTVGPNWLNAKDEDGQRRLDQSDDYVRVEIAAALSRDIPVIPVLIDGARVPNARELPGDVAALTRRNAVEVRSSHFRRDADELTQKISEVLKEKGSAHRRLVLPIIGVLLALMFGWVGIYQAQKGSLPWMHSGTTSQIANPSIETTASLPGKPDAISANQTSTDVVLAQKPTCKSGFVWRVASPDDLVCVTPESRARAAEENRTASSRIQPGGGASGPFTCLSAFVWREAFEGDFVCVTPEVRTLVREEIKSPPIGACSNRSSATCTRRDGRR